MPIPRTFYSKEKAEAKSSALRENLFQTMIVPWPIEGYKKATGYVIMFRSYSFEPWHYLISQRHVEN